MYYEIDSNGNKLRPLHGYFKGFKKDLASIDIFLLSDIQKDYLSIPEDRIIEVPEKEHCLLELQKTNKLMVKAELAEIDQKSIRSIREWIASYPDAPEYLKQYESEAVEKRTKLK